MRALLVNSDGGSKRRFSIRTELISLLDTVFSPSGLQTLEHTQHSCYVASDVRQQIEEILGFSPDQSGKNLNGRCRVTENTEVLSAKNAKDANDVV